MEKLAIEKLQSSQVTKILALERRLKDSTNLIVATVKTPSNPRHKTIDSKICSGEKEVGEHNDFDGSKSKFSSPLNGSSAIH